LQEKEQESRRTRAKEKVYKYINRRIKEMKKGFNMSTSTHIKSGQDHWIHNYRHWKFTPGAFKTDTTFPNENILFGAD